jgi:hydroxymethylpyrimidine kinase / phosphomethylpyrimidine kinase / thiamine-phosphate diphosphorylase
MNLLSIAGSDPSSGAGIQSDVKTFTSLGAYALTVITSITSQNTRKFGKIEPVSAKMIKAQLDSVFSDFRVDGIKIGMVYNSNIIRAIHSRLSKVKAPIILDPVIKSTTGGMLLKKDALNEYKKLLVPLAEIISPNVSEACSLVGGSIKNKDDLLKTALKIKKLGAKNIIITGTVFEKKLISDFILEDSKSYFIKGKKLNRRNHGSGCNFSASLMMAIAHGKKLRSAVKFAKNYTYNSIKNSKKIGGGITITLSPVNLNDNKIILEKAISDFSNFKKICSFIPECQTNFVFSKEKTKSIKDILGVSGRIVKAGRDVIVAGSIEYGGSKHVGSALLQVRKKFPNIRSAVNLKYDPNLITYCKKIGFCIESYNRSKEPLTIKRKEDSSILWGIKQSIKNSKVPPDLIYHKGDFGKEPMMIVFGKNPNEVVEKISKIL